MQIPDGYVGLIRERSGMAKSGISVRGGVIDCDYRGEVKILLATSADPGEIAIQPGAAIAQMVVIPCLLVGSEEVVALDETARGGGGFGSTGR